MRLNGITQSTLLTLGSDLQMAAQRLKHRGPELQRERQKVDDLTRVAGIHLRTALFAAHAQIEQRLVALDSLNPQRTLERGYAIVQQESGKVVSRAGSGAAGRRAYRAGAGRQLPRCGRRWRDAVATTAPADAQDASDAACPLQSATALTQSLVPERAVMPQAAFIYSDQLSRHVLRADHPLKAIRLRMTNELLQAYGAFELPDAILSEPRPATVEELLPVHNQEYVEAVHGISDGDVSIMAERYGFSPLGDNPAFPGMYEAAMLATGASHVAAELVAAEAVPVAFNISGGLHHAAQGRASGFCVFNDPAVAIAALRQQGMRVAYVDIDAHHGDGGPGRLLCY